MKSNWKLKQMMVKKMELKGGGNLVYQGTENKAEEDLVMIFCSYLLQKPFRDNIFGSENKH